MGKTAEMARQDASTSGKLKRVSIISATIVLPLFIALWVGFKADLEKVSLYLFWIFLLLLVATSIVLAVLNLSGSQLVQQAYFENLDLSRRFDELNSQNGELENALGYLSIIQEANIAWRVMQRKYFNNVGDVADAKEAIEEILSILVYEGTKIFGFGGSERWNFSVYLFDDRDKLLKPIWRERHMNHPSENMGRHWKGGQGHIGKAFVDGEAKITGNANDADVMTLVRAPAGLLRDYDDDVYCSFASIPIGPVNNNDEPLGVLTATSDQAGRFDLESCLALRHAAGVLANLIYMNQINPHILIDAATTQGDDANV